MPSYKIYEDEKVYAFLDIHPLTRGHTLIVPKVEIDYFADLPTEYAQALMLAAQKIAPALDTAMQYKRTQMIIAGWDVPHCHIHLVPSESIADIRKAETLELSNEEMLAIQSRIVNVL
ncbi:MAG: HIT domain-containing protein [bacterium]|nr:HIT domain-containing protein [bacterium]